MKAIILAAGYGTRLVNSAKDDRDLTEDLRNEIISNPKPLLHLGRRRVIDIILEKIQGIEPIDEVVIVTNQTFYQQFKDWARNFKYSKPLSIVNDGTTSNENRLGAIKDIQLAIRQQEIDDDVFILGGDTIIAIDYRALFEMFKKRNASVTVGTDCHSIEIARQHGVITVRSLDGLITDFEEKPAEPKSTLLAPCIYLIKKGELHLIDEYLRLSPKSDAPGYFLEYFIKQTRFYALLTDAENYHDIGNLKSYKHSIQSFS
jgi:glucose-1-phosphate thymidylyltransferase